MPARSSLTCNFSISSSLDIGVWFASDYGVTLADNLQQKPT